MDDQQGLKEYLTADDVGDWQHPAIREQARELARGVSDRVMLAERCFTFVRDAISHSFDINAKSVSCSASEVLQSGHGICYAKSHLLSALLRANGIPAGFSYQRLVDDDLGFALHGFNTIHLPQYGWYRADARGNKPEVNAQFSPPREQLAFSNDSAGECDYGVNFSSPLPSVVQALRATDTIEQMRDSLPRRIDMG